MTKFIYILFSVLLTAYTQLIIKWRLTKATNIPNEITQKFIFLTKSIFMDFYLISGFAAAFFASLCWMIALKKLQLNVAYPLMSLSYIIVFIFSILLFNEKTSFLQILGISFILLGVSLIGYSVRGGT